MRVIKTKLSLYNGLLELMKEKSFEEIKVSEMCSKSLINRSTFYDHFGDKNDLFNNLIDDLKNGLITNLKVTKETSNIHDYFLEVINLLLLEIENKKDIFSSLVKNNNSHIARDMFSYATYNTVLSYIEDRYENTTNMKTEDIINYYLSGVINITLCYLQDVKNFNRNNLMNNFRKLIPHTEFFILKK